MCFICKHLDSSGMEIDQVARAIEDNPDAKAVLVNNPTYYGICSDLRAIVKLAHSRGIKVLTDDALVVCVRLIICLT